jgi:hypothetical protein
MRIAQTFAHSPADFSSFAGFHPNHWVHTRNVREFELVNTVFGILRPLGSRIVKGRHVLAPTDFLKLGILVADAQPIQLGLALLGRDWMLGYRRIALADVTGLGEDPTNCIYLVIRQAMNMLQLLEQNLILLF